MTEFEQIAEIFLEARGYGLDNEVKEWAQKLHAEDPTITLLQAYQEAFNEWIK